MQKIEREDTMCWPIKSLSNAANEILKAIIYEIFLEQQKHNELKLQTIKCSQEQIFQDEYHSVFPLDH